MKEFVSESLLHEHYKLIHPLQQQAGKATWLAEDVQTQQGVIVKILDLGTMPDWDALRLFEREVQVLQNLNHPRIPQVLDQFQTSDPPRQFIVLSEIKGQSLSQQLEQHGPLTESQAKSLAQQVLEILVYLQSFSPAIIHRDIKPDNLLLKSETAERDKQVSLIDFGAVKDISATQHTVVGTFGYLAPEQLTGQAGPASDLYALGVTLYVALSGLGAEALPREGLRIQLPKDLKLSRAFANWLQDLIAPELSLRFKTAVQALEALNSLKVQPEQTTAPITPPAGSRLKVLINQPECLEIQVGRRNLLYLLLLLILPVCFAFSFSLPVLLVLFEMGWISPRFDLLSNLLKGQVLIEWLPILPVALLIYFGFAIQFYRLWFRPFKLCLLSSQMSCQSLSGKKMYWQIDLEQGSGIQLLQRMLRIQTGLLKGKQITVALSGDESQMLKNILRDYLRRNLSREQFQKFLPGLRV